MFPGIFALVQAATDTVVARVVLPEPTVLDRFIDIAGSLLMLVALALLVVAIWAAFRLKAAFETAKDSLNDVRGDLRELVSAANKIGSDVQDVTASVRNTVGSVSETVTYTSERAHTAVSRLADRVDAFNDALELVQQDTQDVIVTALATLRGVRAGVAAMRKPHKSRRDGRRYRDDDDEPPDLPVRPRLRRRARAGE